MPIAEPGIYPEIPVDEYFADPCPTPSLTQSLAKRMIDTSPAHAWAEHPRNPLFEQPVQQYHSDMAIGNAYHLLMAERGKKMRLINERDFRTKRAQEQRDLAWEQGLEPVLDHHWQVAASMAKVAAMQLQGMGLPEAGDGQSEVMLAWEEDGVWCRSLVDWISDDRKTVVDYKTGFMSCAPHAIAAKMVSDGFPVQAAFHARGLAALDPENAGRRQHLFICQESKPPYGMTVVRMSEATMYFGFRQVEWAIKTWRNCVLTNTWIGYPPMVVEPELPPWVEQRWMEREGN